MKRETPKQAFAVREAHQALLELKKLVDEAAITTHAAALESFHLAAERGGDSDVRKTLENVKERLQSPAFEALLVQAREKLEIAAAA
jgi:hypothetical protein